MKVFFRVYEYKDTIEEEFSSTEEVEKAMSLMNKERPDWMIEPYFQVDESSVHISQSW